MRPCEHFTLHRRDSCTDPRPHPFPPLPATTLCHLIHLAPKNRDDSTPLLGGYNCDGADDDKRAQRDPREGRHPMFEERRVCAAALGDLLATTRAKHSHAVKAQVGGAGRAASNRVSRKRARGGDTGEIAWGAHRGQEAGLGDEGGAASGAL